MFLPTVTTMLPVHANLPSRLWNKPSSKRANGEDCNHPKQDVYKRQLKGGVHLPDFQDTDRNDLTRVTYTFFVWVRCLYCCAICLAAFYLFRMKYRWVF